MPDPPKETAVQEFRITPFQQAAASCTGAVITSFFVTPLDVVKTRIQAQQKTLQSCFLYCNGLMDHYCKCEPTEKNSWYHQRPNVHFNGTVDAFVKITKHEGVGSLWSGLSPTLVLAIPSTIVYFVSYEQLRLKLKDHHNKNNAPLQEATQPFWIPLVSGATARLISATMVNPLELIRTKMNSQKLSYREMGEALQFLIKNDGVKGLWRGITPSLLRDVPFSAVYWIIYEATKKRVASETPSFGTSFMCGGIAGSIAAFLTVPSDVVKTHKQIDFGTNKLYAETPRRTKSTLEVFKEIYAMHGARGLFAGTVPRVVKVAPACAIMISSFEYGKVKKQQAMMARGAETNRRKDHSGRTLWAS